MLRDLEKVNIVECMLADYFGMDAKVKGNHHPFDYAGTAKGKVDRRELGLDFGLIQLRPYFRMHLEANGVVAVTEENWQSQHRVEDMRGYAMLGFPGLERCPDGSMGAMTTLVNVKKMDRFPDEFLDCLEEPIRNSLEKNLWFVGRIDDSVSFSIEGMSGGPIFGFAIREGQPRYWVVALQSAWFPKWKIILGCSIPYFAFHISREIEEAESAEDPKNR